MAVQDYLGSEAPMFIPFQPARLDLSPVDRANELRNKLLMDAIAKEQKVLADARALEIPEVEGKTTDAIEYYRSATTEKQGMVDMLADSDNMIATSRSPEYRAKLARFNQITSPAVATALKSRKEDQAVLTKKIADANTKGDPIATLPATGPNGLWMPDPENPKEFLSIQRAAEVHEYGSDYHYGTDQYGVGAAFSPASMAQAITPKEYRENLNATFDKAKETAFGSKGEQATFDNYSENVAKLTNPNLDPYSRLMLTTVVESKHSDNFNQIRAAIEELKSTMTVEERNAILSVYQDYAKNEKGDPKYLDKNGVVSYAKLYKMAFNEDKYEIQHAGTGKKEKVSFADYYIWLSAQKHLKSNTWNARDLPSLKEVIDDDSAVSDKMTHLTLKNSGLFTLEPKNGGLKYRPDNPQIQHLEQRTIPVVTQTKNGTRVGGNVIETPSFPALDFIKNLTEGLAPAPERGAPSTAFSGHSNAPGAWYQGKDFQANLITSLGTGMKDDVARQFLDMAEVNVGRTATVLPNDIFGYNGQTARSEDNGTIKNDYVSRPSNSLGVPVKIRVQYDRFKEFLKNNPGIFNVPLDSEPIATSSRFNPYDELMEMTGLVVNAFGGEVAIKRGEDPSVVSDQLFTDGGAHKLRPASIDDLEEHGYGQWADEDQTLILPDLKGSGDWFYLNGDYHILYDNVDYSEIADLKLKTGEQLGVGTNYFTEGSAEQAALEKSKQMPNYVEKVR